LAYNNARRDFRAANFDDFTAAKAVAVGDFNGDGYEDVAVALAGFTEAGVSILFGDANGILTNYSPSAYYNTGGNAVALVTADFNGDNILDLAVVNDGSNVGILLGNGAGGFANRVLYTVGTNPKDIVIGDFNGDGILDLAVSNQDSSTISILIGNRDGTFAAAQNYNANIRPYRLTMGDFNNDGLFDLAVGNQNSNTVSVLLNRGSIMGTWQGFNAPLLLTLPSGTGSPEGVVAGDFNRDGKMDLAIAVSSVTPPETRNLLIYLGNGNGTFTLGNRYAVGNNPVALTAGDFDNDAAFTIDLAVVVKDDNKLVILLGVGDGTFAITSTSYVIGSDSQWVQIGDFNADGIPDLVTANGRGGTVSLLFGTGYGALLRRPNLAPKAALP
jgi:hypothetical protein